MTIAASLRKAGPYQGNDAAHEFPFPFKLFDKTELKAVKTDPQGTEQPLVLDADYAVRLNPDQNATPGGSVLYPLHGPKLQAGESLTLTGQLPNTQPTSLPNHGSFNARTIENALDRAVMQVQQLAEENERALKFPVSDPSRQVQLPTARQRAGKALVCDADGNISTGKDQYDDQARNAAKSAAQAAASAQAACCSAKTARKIVEEAEQLGTPADGAVTTPKLAPEAVTEDKIASEAVTGSKIAAQTIYAAHLAPWTVVVHLGYTPANLDNTWTTDKFDPASKANAGAICQHGDGIWEFGGINSNYWGPVDLPGPWVMAGIRGDYSTGIAVYVRARTLHNQ